MKENTKKEYIRLAEHFVKNVQATEAAQGYTHVPPSEYMRHLTLRAETTTPAYWRRLRRSLEVYCRHSGWTKAANQYRDLKNPVTSSKQPLSKEIKKATAKRHKLKTISGDDANALYKTARSNGDNSVAAAIRIIYKTGCRPSELNNIRVIDGAIYIDSVKKDSANSRGLDRIIKMSDRDTKIIAGLIRDLDAEAKNKRIQRSDVVARVQRRFDYLAKRLFPRKSGLCLYTFRHQTGANLKSQVKAGTISRKEAAYLMGHRVTASLNTYGDVRRGNSSSSAMRADGDYGVVVDNHIDISANRELLQPVVTHSAEVGMDYGL